MLTYEKIKLYYDKGLWSTIMVQNAVVKKIITQEQANKIIGHL